MNECLTVLGFFLCESLIKKFNSILFYINQSIRAFTVHLSSCVHFDVEIEEKEDSTDDNYILNKNIGEKLMLSASSSQHKLVNDENMDAYVQTSDLESKLGTCNGRMLAFRDFIIVVALSIHAIFEGLAIGLEPHSADIWILFAGKME